MKEIINYYYNLNPKQINKITDYYYFYINNELYYFTTYTRKIEDINSIYEYNKQMLNNNILVNEIIPNKDINPLTYINQKPYILMKILININKPTNLPEINYISNKIIPYQDKIMRSNWINLWTNKLDYLEYHHEQNKKKYPLLNQSFNYFIGLTENAISYLNNITNKLTKEKSDIGVTSHNYINNTIYSLYNPLNIIIDHKSRDIAEYIKLSFFNDNYNIFEELDEYFKHNYFSQYGITLLIARILYPSFYFDTYDKIINNLENESSILKITSRITEYEKYLNDILTYFHKYYNIKDIEWIKKEVKFH